MNKRKLSLIIVLVLVAMLAAVSRVAAHPLGNFSINRYSRLEAGAEAIRLLYVVDMAEIPTFQERQLIDSNDDGQITPAEEAAYLEPHLAALAAKLHLTVNGTALPLESQSADLSFPPGQGDLPTLRLEIEFSAALPAATMPWRVNYRDDNYAGRAGWQEVVVHAGQDVTLFESTAPAQDISNALRAYPADLLQNPPATNSVAFRFEPAAAGRATTAANDPAPAPRQATAAIDRQNRFGQDEFADLLATALDRPGAILIAVLVAMGLGAAHALTPGHGKTIVGAYLVGSRGTARHALFLGLTTTVTHTAGVFAFGLFVLFASRFILPEQLYPWLGVLSGLLVVLIGFSLFRAQLRQLLGPRRRGADHEQVEGYHYHFGVGHTHTLPANDATSWRNLLALGVSGGLLPCPSALVLLLSAIALQRVGFGLMLIVAFSVGLASVLTGIGIVLVYAGRLFERVPVRHRGLARALPLASALFITMAGVAITVQALIQTRASW